ncbi:MAG: CDP-diacylglycerol--serine O-phosphatidyltransferase [Verrucomicrobia bacterium]|nr:MAG: CDP-diacylglycerol--serine O-phosphatidyltransferase [Verrucomicrobiota bacterium]
MRLEAKDKRIETGDDHARLKVYFLPNLMTAGNLFCGFLALTKIVEADVGSPTFNSTIRIAIGLILLACIFDLLDGRVARMGGAESPFGREFDSLADVVSFGVAPAFLVHRIVLKDVFVNHPGIGWFIASIYLICGAFRLARFNCLATISTGHRSTDFLGFPIPAAAGLVASLTLFILWWEDKDFGVSYWRYSLPVIMIFLSIMMVSEVRYPSFKKLDMRATRPFFKTVVLTLSVGLLVIAHKLLLPIVLPAIFTAYLIYGFIRPRISHKMRRGIEDEDEDHDDGAPISVS